MVLLLLLLIPPLGLVGEKHNSNRCGVKGEQTWLCENKPGIQMINILGLYDYGLFEAASQTSARSRRLKVSKRFATIA